MLSTVMLGSYLFFIVLPVDSPYYLSPHLGPPLSGHFFFDLVHQISARGGARGGAFPSAHVSGAIVVILVAWRHQRRLAYLLLPIIGGVMMATVYGRFHYVLDTLAGRGPGGRGRDGVPISLGRRPARNSQLTTLLSACLLRTACASGASPDTQTATSTTVDAVRRSATDQSDGGAAFRTAPVRRSIHTPDRAARALRGRPYDARVGGSKMKGHESRRSGALGRN